MRVLLRLLAAAALVVVVIACVSTARSGADSATLNRRGGPHEIYFFQRPSSAVALVGQHLPIPNPFVSRPSGFPLFEDGQWVLEKLHWRGWGLTVAKATGKSNSDTDVPNVAEGKRIITWAKVRLSQPGVFHGRRIYRCIRVTVPPPANYPAGCLQRSHRYIGLMAPGSGEPVGVQGGSNGKLRLTNFMSPNRKVWCQIASFGAECGTEPEPPTHSAQLKPNGKVSLCSVLQTEYPEGSKVPLTCFQNWPLPSDHVPVLGIGKTTQDSGFRCTSSSEGITCTDVAGAGKGHGFRVNEDEAVEVGS